MIRTSTQSNFHAAFFLECCIDIYLWQHVYSLSMRCVIWAKLPAGVRHEVFDDKFDDEGLQAGKRFCGLLACHFLAELKLDVIAWMHGKGTT